MAKIRRRFDGDIDAGFEARVGALRSGDLEGDGASTAMVALYGTARGRRGRVRHPEAPGDLRPGGRAPCRLTPTPARSARAISA